MRTLVNILLVLAMLWLCSGCASTMQRPAERQCNTDTDCMHMHGGDGGPH